MLPGHGNRDLFKHPPMTAVYCIRPYCSDDKVRSITEAPFGLYLKYDLT